MSRIFTKFLREGDPIRAQQIVDFEHNFAGPSRYQVTQNIHPVEEMDGDGTAAPYDGAQLGGGMGGAGMPPGGAPGGDQMTDMASAPPGTTPGAAGPGQPGADQENAPPMQEARLREQGYYGGVLPPNMPPDAMQQQLSRGPYRSWERPITTTQMPPQAPAAPQRAAVDPYAFGSPSTPTPGTVGRAPYNPAAGAPSTVKPPPANSATGSTSSEHGLVPNTDPVIKQQTPPAQTPLAPKAAAPTPGQNWQQNIKNIPDFDQSQINTVNAAGGGATGAGVMKNSFAEPANAATPATRAAVAKSAAASDAAGVGRTFGSIGRAAGRIAPIISGGMAGVDDYKQTGNLPHAATVGAGTAAGTGIGAGVGSAIGAGLGALGGPISPVTVPLGAMAGGAIGGYFGGQSGQAISNKAADTMFPTTPQTTATTQKENVMRDDFDLFLDELLRIDETPDEIAEAPADWVNQGNAPRNYAGFQGPQQAPASIAAGGPGAVQNWQRQMQSVRGPAAPVGGGVTPSAGGAVSGASGAPAPRPSRATAGSGGGMAPRFTRGSNPGVADLQKQLMGAGFDVGHTQNDGIMGRNTQNAISAAKAQGYSVTNGKLMGPQSPAGGGEIAPPGKAMPATPPAAGGGEIAPPGRAMPATPPGQWAGGGERLPSGNAMPPPSSGTPPGQWAGGGERLPSGNAMPPVAPEGTPMATAAIPPKESLPSNDTKMESWEMTWKDHVLLNESARPKR